ncbi:MAG: right-handed parallel beta-helix repeat-containing protein, partial [Candidatus Latescibacterota bacterium]
MSFSVFPASYKRSRLTIIFLLTFIASLCAYAPLLLAATYYVDAAGGNDGNSGASSDAPWRTVGKVNRSRFSPGDQILFRRGQTWRETLVIPSSGVSGRHIVFGAYGSGNKPVFDAEKRREFSIEGNNKDFITLSGLDAANAKKNGIYFHSGDPNYITVENSVARGSGDLGMLFKGAHNVTVRNSEAYGNYWNGFANQTFTATYTVGPFTYENNISHHNGHTGFDFQAAPNTQSIKGITVRNIKAYNNGHNGMYVCQYNGTSVSDVTVANSTFNNNGRVGLYIEDNGRSAPYARNVNVSSSHMYGNGTSGEVTSPGFVGFMQNSRVTNSRIYDNQARWTQKIEVLVHNGGGGSNSFDGNQISHAGATNIISWNGRTYTHAGFQDIGQNR